MYIPYHTPYLSDTERQLIEDALKKGALGGDGFYTEKVKTWFKEKYLFKNIFLTTSGTHALEMAMLLIGLEPEDEVIMPSFTFPSTANAVLLRGAKPVFVEIEAETLNIDPEDLARKVTERTKAIIPVHYAGIGCKMDLINRIAAEHQITVVEDAAQGVHAGYKGRYLGSWGDLGCFSFHSTKNFTSGEGGALIVNYEDSSWSERAEIILQKGTNRRQFLRGEVEKYTWMEIGSSYAPSDLLMALLYAQLGKVEQITEKRKRIHDFYTSRLQDYVGDVLAGITKIPTDCDSNYHLFYLLFQDEKQRNEVRDKLRAAGIEAVIHYVPLHSSPMGLRLGYRPTDLPLTEKISRTLLRLPMSAGLSEIELEYIVSKLCPILAKLKRDRIWRL